MFRINPMPFLQTDSEGSASQSQSAESIGGMFGTQPMVYNVIVVPDTSTPSDAAPETKKKRKHWTKKLFSKKAKSPSTKSSKSNASMNKRNKRSGKKKPDEGTASQTDSTNSASSLCSHYTDASSQTDFTEAKGIKKYSKKSGKN